MNSDSCMLGKDGNSSICFKVLFCTFTNKAVLTYFYSVCFSYRYLVHDMLGQGTFGQVFKCSTQEDGGGMVAVKVIKNQAAYYHQARVEIGVLQFLNTRADPNDNYHIVRLKDFFLHKSHLCLVFELLNLNLFELVRHNKFRGLSLSLVRVFLTQVIKALVVLNNSNIIHCDIKPENILLTDATSGEVKLIDFGSACFANRTVYSYIQSRFYRSPEVILGHPYTVAVDMWSLGCVAAELFLGLPLFPAACELDLLGRIGETIGPLPDHLMMNSKNTRKFYTADVLAPGGMRLCTVEEFTASTGQKAPRGKQYFQHKALADIISAYPFRSGLGDIELSRERKSREVFTDFLLGLLDVDPLTRWTPRQAQMHPFITGAPFSGPFQASPDPTIVSSPMSTSSLPLSGFMATPGIPMSIPQPRPRAQNTTMDGLAALLTSSPQVHAQAAAMAVVQMQMSLQQQQGRGGSAGGDGMPSSSYVPAHSLQKIMDPMMASALSQRTSSEGGEMSWRQGGAQMGQSLPTPLFSPPSRSFGVHLASMGTPSELPPSSFDPGQQGPHRIMPLMHHMATGGDHGVTSPVAFQPSSVSTYRSTLAAAVDSRRDALTMPAPMPRPRLQVESSKAQQREIIGVGGNSGTSAQQIKWETPQGVVALEDLSLPVLQEVTAQPANAGGLSVDTGSNGGNTPRTKEESPPSVPQQEDLPNPADWDPLWSDDLLAEEEEPPKNTCTTAQQNMVVVGFDTASNNAIRMRASFDGIPPRTFEMQSRKDSGLSLAVQHLSQLQPLHLGTPPSVPIAGFTAATWPSGQLNITSRDTEQRITSGVPNSSNNIIPQDSGGPLGGESTMLWSPPRLSHLQPLPGVSSGQSSGIQSIGNTTGSGQFQEPMQRLHGFVVTNSESEPRSDA